MDKEDVYIYNGILLSHQKWNTAIHTKVGDPRDYHTKWSKSDRERQVTFDITYMRNLKNGINAFIYKTNRLIDTEKKLMVAKRIHWGFEINRYILQCMK